MVTYFVMHLLALSLISIFTNSLFANEIFNVEHAISTGTNQNDVKGLTALQNKFTILQAWTGDPCTGYISWYWTYWIDCNTDPTPRVIALKLANGGTYLSGTLPDFSSMDALETIDLSNNYLSGEIPEFLGTMPKLKKLNLENNYFTGTIPTSLVKNKNLDLRVAGNVNLCASDKSCENTDTPTNTPSYSETPYFVTYGEQKKKKKSKLPIILGILIPLFVLFWVAVGAIAISNHKRKSAVVAAMVAASNDPEMKVQEGEINMTDQQENTPANQQNNVNP